MPELPWYLHQRARAIRSLETDSGFRDKLPLELKQDEHLPSDVIALMN